MATGVRTFYREEGEGEPVVLMHGGLMGGDSWGSAVGALARRYRVLVPDRRGHGRTPDVEGPYTYEAMAEETIAFLEQVAGGPAHLVGYSDGGNVALLVARDRPDLVADIVTIGSNYHVNGLHPGVLAGMAEADPTSPDLAVLREPYEATSPDGPEHWPVFAAKMFEMGVSSPTMTADDLARIDCPVLVIAADDDIVLPEHTIALFGSLSQGQLAIVPGTSHALPDEKPALLMSLIRAFLDDPAPERLMPMRFAS